MSSGLRQEQIVFAGTVLLLGFLVYRDLANAPVTPRGGGRSGDPPVFDDHRVPDVQLALAGARSPDDLRRALFEPPREVRPLPPLPLAVPPLEPLASLVPPPVPGPAPHMHGPYLRSARAAIDEPELFGEGDEIGSLLGDEPGEALEEVDESLLTPAERSQRLERNKQLYDWIRIPRLLFGQIQNEDRYTLARRPTEPIRFVELNPDTGQERFPGQPPIEFARERVEEFGFADNVTNRIELRRLEFADPLTHGQYEEALAFGRWCIEERLSAPRALAVAEEMFRRAQPLAEQDPAPRLGLARCYEAAFDFERAYGIYQELLAGRFAQHPTVLTRLAQLEWRFLMKERALARLVEAERYGRTSWEVQWTLGRLLYELGRYEEASEHLALAGRYEPSAPADAPARADIRADLGAARLALGDLPEARAWFQKAQQAERDHQGALAGLLAVAYLERGGGTNGGTAAGGVERDAIELEGAGPGLLLASGLDALAAGDWFGARDRLQLAAQADPLGASRAWRALAWLAGHAGHGEEALRYIELALENDPTDVYALFKRGRLLADREDLPGARESFVAALDREVEYADALIALGWIAFGQEQHEDAERYLERALTVTPDQAGWHALRGLNWLRLSRVTEAEASFRAALELRRAHPIARNGLAWVQYARGDSFEAITLFREHDDERRSFPENDPHRVYARHQIERIQDHLEKVVWSDRFEREELRNNWMEEEATGPTIRMRDGAAWIDGDFRSTGRARFWRTRNAADFVSLEARITVLPGTTARVGMFVSKERFRQRGSETEIQTEVTISRHRDGSPQARFMQRGGDDSPHADVPIVDWPAGEAVTVRIERTGSSSDTRLRIVVDGIPVAEEPMPNMGQTTDELRMGIFAEGEPGRSVQVRVDEVELVFRQR